MIGGFLLAALLPGGDAGGRVQTFEREALFDREEAGAVADEHQVRRLLHDLARQRGDVTYVLDAGDRAAIKGAAVHDASVEGHRADAIREAAVADGINRRIVLDRLRSRERGVESRSVGFKKGQGGAGGDFAKLPRGNDDRFVHVFSSHGVRLPV